MTKQRMAFAGGEEEDAVLGSRLREAREYIGLKQEEVGRHLGIPRTAVSEMESGKRGVSALELKKLARLYQRPVAWFTGEEEAAPLPADVAFLARTVSGLSDNDRAELQRFAEFLRAKGKAASDDTA
jgi:transcriptional regulator with XRE-family HTH domain